MTEQIAKHQWQKKANGEIDEEAVYAEDETMGHEGPICTVCGFSFCINCDSFKSEEQSEWNDECPGEGD